MASMTQEKKAIIQSELGTFMPADWRYGLSIKNKTTIVMTIWMCPTDLLGEVRRVSGGDTPTALSHHEVASSCLWKEFDNSLLLIGSIRTALHMTNVPGVPPHDHKVRILLGNKEFPFLDTVPAPLTQKYSKSGYAIA